MTLVVAACVLVGALVGVASAVRQGEHYSATVSLRSATFDPACVYSTCPNPRVTAVGYRWPVGQTNQLQSSDMAENVHRNLPGAPPVDTLISNVRAKTVGNSYTISLTYTDPSERESRRVAWAYAQRYAKWANDYAADVMRTELETSTAAFDELTLDEQLHTQRGRDLSMHIDEVRSALLAYEAGNGPGSPIVYASSAEVLPSQRITPGTWRAALMGAGAGLVVGLGIVLLRRPAPSRQHVGLDGHAELV